MVKINRVDPSAVVDHSSLSEWVRSIAQIAGSNQPELIQQAADLAYFTGEHTATPFGHSCLHHGLDIAAALAELGLDSTAMSAAILFGGIKYGDLDIGDVEEQTTKPVADLLKSVLKMSAIDSMMVNQNTNGQVDNLRKMLLAMVEDVRVVLIKLAERIVIMRAVHIFGEDTRKQITQETMDVYAPLANRLGIAQFKWELEDLAFRNLQPDTYKSIASSLSERRIDRENRIQFVKSFITSKLKSINIEAEITGRAKHIYSIFRKMQRKGVGFEEIYDASAIRVFTDNVEDCYKVLSIIHEHWDHVPEEFDDYVTNPKPNGYQSIHTVIITEGNKHVEIQIRTHQMHEAAEFGVAAHWMYKEGKSQVTSYEAKIDRLRQLLEWHKEIAHGEEPLEQFHDHVFEDRIYIFTPQGHIMDLAKGATPLDFAYHIHSDVGHKCKGAKVGGKMVPLTHQLETGSTVEIVTNNKGTPSRDWLNPDLGYINTSRARAKVQHWFNQQNQDEHLHSGKQILDKEVARWNLQNVNLEKLSQAVHARSTDLMYASLSRGNVKISQITQALHKQFPQQVKLAGEESQATHEPKITEAQSKKSKFQIQGLDNLLTHFAGCCKPIPGDSIVGYITQGRGVSIHRSDCNHIKHISDSGKQKLLEVSWGNSDLSQYQADIAIHANDNDTLLTKINNLLSNEKITVNGLQKFKHQQKIDITLTVQVDGHESLNRLVEQINQIPQVIQAKRIGIGG